MTGWNLPPGVSVTDDAINPGEDEETKRDPYAGTATPVYEVCCAICEEYEHVVPPLRDNADGVGFVKDPDFGWVHKHCRDSWEAP